VLAGSASLMELAQHGSGELAAYLDREHPPRTALEWLGIAVGALPDLAAHARTADEIQWRARAQDPDRYAPLLDALERALGTAAAFVHAALRRNLRRHPASGDAEAAPEREVEDHADLLVAAHRRVPRRAEFLVGGYASFLSAAIEAAGALAEAELAAARARRWERADHQREVHLRASQLHSALVNALGELLAYARLTAEEMLRGGPSGAA
jgi:hypothetical protein